MCAGLCGLCAHAHSPPSPLSRTHIYTLTHSHTHTLTHSHTQATGGQKEQAYLRALKAGNDLLLDTDPVPCGGEKHLSLMSFLLGQLDREGAGTEVKTTANTKAATAAATRGAAAAPSPSGGQGEWSSSSLAASARRVVALRLRLMRREIHEGEKQQARQQDRQQEKQQEKQQLRAAESLNLVKVAIISPFCFFRFSCFLLLLS